LAAFTSHSGDIVSVYVIACAKRSGDISGLLFCYGCREQWHTGFEQDDAEVEEESTRRRKAAQHDDRWLTGPDG
jgi:hypothetical protein